MRVAAAVLAAAVLFSGGPAGADETPPTRAELERLVRDGEATTADMLHLAQMYASGDHGKKDRREAIRLWAAAADAGDRSAPILIADEIFEQIWGRGARPGSGTLTRVGRIPQDKVAEALKWYRIAAERDDRPDVRARAEIGVVTMMSLQQLKR